jgi:hypothetical protein
MLSKIGHHASSTCEIEDTKSVIFELALEVLHPEHETFQLWLSAWETPCIPWEKKFTQHHCSFQQDGASKS